MVDRPHLTQAQHILAQAGLQRIADALIPPLALHSASIVPPETLLSWRRWDQQGRGLEYRTRPRIISAPPGPERGPDRQPAWLRPERSASRPPSARSDRRQIGRAHV